MKPTRRSGNAHAIEAHADVLEGREVVWYVPTPVREGSGDGLWWVLEIGPCDVGTEIKYVASQSWEATYSQLVEWYWAAALEGRFLQC